MTGSDIIFLDTAPIIYCLEKNELYHRKIFSFFEKYGDARYATSVVTIAEYFPHPFRQGNGREAVQAFNQFIRGMRISIVDINRTIARKSAGIRSQYPGIKGMDALQLAAAIECRCSIFLTNDRQLRQVREIPCLMLDEWES